MDQTLGKRIVSNRKRLGMTQDKLAEHFGVDGVRHYALAEMPFNADGTINSSGYKYMDGYINGLSNTEWTKVETTFTLDADQQICWVVMNSKNPGKDVLIDDFTVSTADGGLVE